MSTPLYYLCICLHLELSLWTFNGFTRTSHAAQRSRSAASRVLLSTWWLKLKSPMDRLLYPTSASFSAILHWYSWLVQAWIYRCYRGFGLEHLAFRCVPGWRTWLSGRLCLANRSLQRLLLLRWPLMARTYFHGFWIDILTCCYSLDAHPRLPPK